MILGGNLVKTFPFMFATVLNSELHFSRIGCPIEANEIPVYHMNLTVAEEKKKQIHAFLNDTSAKRKYCLWSELELDLQILIGWAANRYVIRTSSRNEYCSQERGATIRTIFV